MSERPRRRIPLWTIPAVLIGLVLIGLPLTQLTDTGVEQSVKETLGLTHPTCESQTADSPGWSEGVELPDKRDEPRAIELDGQIYLAGGIRRIIDYGDPSRVPGVPERVEVETLANFTRFDPRTGRYTELAPMPEALNHIGIATYKGDIYVVAGHGKLLWGADPEDDFFRYSVKDDRWTVLPELPTARGAVATDVIGDRLYVAGGMANGTALTTVEAYDFGDGRWHRVADMPGPREHVAEAVLDGKMYLLGGRDRHTDALPSAVRYDPRTDRWERLPDMPVPSGGMEAIAFDDTIIGIGGGNDRAGTVTGAVQRFDPRTGEWRRLPDMRTARHGFASAIVDDRVYTIGGSQCALFAPTPLVEVFTPRSTVEG